MNEHYSHPEIPKDKKTEAGILKGMYNIKEFNKYKNIIVITRNLCQSHCNMAEIELKVPNIGDFRDVEVI